MNYSIFNLSDKLEYTEAVIDVLYNEWGDKKKKNYDFWASWVKSSISRKKVPQTFIVISDDKFVGTYSLWRCDLQSRQDLFPWFGGLYILQEYRGKGIGEKMQEHAKRVLKDNGYDEAYLFTDIIGYYERNGWEYIGRGVDENCEEVRLYKIQL